ncbi:MAG: hypothetical protein ABIX28_12415 [Vicinamibacterales bacterium]
MGDFLLFRANSNGEMFGLVTVRRGVATAHAGDLELTRVLFGHALMWLRRHNPHPAADVQFELITALDARG